MRVSRYLADLTHWKDWYPGLRKVQRLGSAADPVRPGCKWELHQKHWTINMPMNYELLELQPGKQIVVSGISEYHTVQDRFYLMKDRTDSGMTVVRHISDWSLREWRSALQPVVSGLLAKVPEQALSNLHSTLNSKRSPLFTPAFEEAMLRERRSSGTRSGSTHSTHSGSGGGSPWSTWAGSLFGSRDGGTTTTSSTGSASPVSSLELEGPADPMGYYQTLGLVLVVGSPGPSQEEVKAAYRKLAMQWHPDRQRGAAPSAQRVASARFAALLAAYEVLKDEETRALYDRGLYVQSTQSF